MDIFAQKKILVRLVVLLALLNLSSIGVFLWKEFSPRNRQEQSFPPPPHGANPHELVKILAQELKLSETQVEQIKQLRFDFHKREEMVLRLIRSQRDSMNTEMFNKNTNDSLILALAKRISANEYQMEMLRFQQSKEFKAVCTPEQLEKFELLMIEIRDYFKPNKPPMGRPR